MKTHVQHLLRCIAVLASCLSASAAFAQEIDPTIVTGFPPGSVFNGSDFDLVNMQTGNLRIQIPLVSVPGRGINASYAYVYDNQGWSAVPNCIDPPPRSNCYVQHHFLPEAGNNMAGTIAGPAGYSWTYRPHGFSCTNGTVTTAYRGFSNYVLREPDGTKHYFDSGGFSPDFLGNGGTGSDFVYEPVQGAGGCSLSGGPSRLYTSDESGWILNVDFNTGRAISAVRKDGLMIQLGASQIQGAGVEDTNGNTLNTGTDTAGRNAPVFTVVDTSTGSETMQYLDSSGTSRTIQFIRVSVPVQTNLCGSAVPPGCTDFTGTLKPVTQILLPNNQNYSFNYPSTNSFGEVASVVLPTGATIAWTWDESCITASNGCPGGRKVKTRTVSVDGQSFQWTYTWGAQDPVTSIAKNTVVDPLNSKTIYTCAVDPFTGKPLQFDPCYHTEYYDPSGALVKTEDISSGSVSGTSCVARVVTTTWNQQNLVTKVETDFDCPFSGATSSSFGGRSVPAFTARTPIEIREFAFGTGAPGALIRKTHFTYLHETGASPQSYLNANILNRPLSKTVYDGAGNQAAQTTFEYDNYTEGLTASGAVQHDSAFLSTAGNTLRGNLTATSRWRNTDGAFLTTRNQYDDAGNIRKTVDPLSHLTTFSYADSWGDTHCTPSGGNAAAYLTAITNALTQTTNRTFNSCTGTAATATDANSKTTTFSYDLLNRRIQTTLPTDSAGNRGQTTTCFTDLGGSTCAQASLPLNIISTTSITSALNHSSTVILDGLGRTSHSQITSDPDGTDTVDTTYDALGRKATVSNPHRTASLPTDGSTTFNYDLLDRVTRLIPPDGTASSNNVSTLYAGNVTTVTDQAGKQRRSISDALGRLIEVDEPGNGPAAKPGQGSASVNGSEQGAGGAPATSGSGTVTTNGTEQSKTIQVVCGTKPNLMLCPETVYNGGTVTITVNGFAASATYGQGSTADSVASSLFTALGASSSPVNVKLSGAVLTLTAKATGAATNYSLSTSATFDSRYFSSASFSATLPSGSKLTGGADAKPPTTFDSGTVTITVNGTQASATYGQGDTTTSLAQRLQSNAGSLPVTVGLSGSTLTLTSKQPGAASNYSLSASSSTSQPGTFSSPSFTISLSGASLTGGADAVPPSLNTPAVTLYTYDVLDNLTNVVQSGSRQRTFTYNSLSQLLTASNPESGAITYSYDNAGNLHTKLDARGITTTYGYDALNRLTGKTYSNSDPSVVYRYDESACLGATACSNIGHRTSMTDSAGSEAWSYDPLGRPITDQRTTSGIVKSTSYTYNLDGSVHTLTYPSGRTITYTPNAAGRTVSAVDSAGPINYATNALYAPSGSLSSLTNGASLVSTFYFNTRLQPCRISIKSTGTAPSSCSDSANIGNLLDMSYNFSLGAGDNGNVTSITNNRDNTRSQSFTYDALNRLASAQTQIAGPNSNCWGLTFGYDIWGNLLSSTSSGAPGCGEPLPLNVSATTSNQVSGFCYDTAGNLLDQAACPASGPHAYTYNAESQLVSTAGVSYLYDGDGKRVSKSNGKLYWYGMGSDTLDETDASGNLTNEYIFFNGKRIARRDSSNNVDYYFADHLGTARVVAGATGAILDDSDFYPFGGERPISSSSGNTYKFTSKERDSESGLDNFGARYMGSSLGRFISPDKPFADQINSNPQSWNLYSYARNNPLRYVDPTGQGVKEFWQALKNSFILTTKSGVGSKAEGSLFGFKASAQSGLVTEQKSRPLTDKPAETTTSIQKSVSLQGGPYKVEYGTKTPLIDPNTGAVYPKTETETSVKAGTEKGENPSVSGLSATNEHEIPLIGATADYSGFGAGIEVSLDAEELTNAVKELPSATTEVLSNIVDLLQNLNPFQSEPSPPSGTTDIKKPLAKPNE